MLEDSRAEKLIEGVPKLDLSDNSVITLCFLDFSGCFLIFLDVSCCFLLFLDVSCCFLTFLDVSGCFLMFLDVSCLVSADCSRYFTLHAAIARFYQYFFPLRHQSHIHWISKIIQGCFADFF